MTKRQEAQQKILNCLAAELGSIFVALDPFAPSFASDLATIVNERVSDAWPRARACLPGLSELNALRQIWAVATQSDIKLAALYQSACLSTSAETVALLDELAAISLPSIKDEIAICLIEARSAGHLVPPSLSQFKDLKSGLRLRYGLANGYAQTPTALKLLQIAATHLNASDYLRAREFGRAISAIVKSGQPLQSLTELEYYLLSKKAVRLAVASEELRKALLPLSIQRAFRAESFTDFRYDHKPEALKQLEILARKLTQLDFESVEKITQSLTLDAETRRLAIQVLPHFGRSMSSNGAGSKSDHLNSSSPESVLFQSKAARKHSDAALKWRSIDPAALAWFDSLPKRFRPPSWWTSSANEVAQKIISGEIHRNSLQPAELKKLQRVWTKNIKLTLWSAKHYWALESDVDLPAKVTLSELRDLSKKHDRFAKAVKTRLAKSTDPRPALAIIKKSNRRAVLLEIRNLCRQADLDWKTWILPALGSPVWTEQLRNQGHGEPDVVLHGINFLLEAGTILEPDGFKDLMTTGYASLSDSAKADRVAKLVRHINTQPEFVKILLSHFPLALVEKALTNAKLAPEAAEYIDENQPQEILYLKWCLKLKHAATAGSLRDLLAERLGRHESIPWNNAWLDLNGKMAERGLALVLAARRSSKCLTLVARSLGYDGFEKGLKQAIAFLPPDLSRERARLELILALGVEAAPALEHVLALMKQTAAAGHKLDHAYYRHELPKQSGGTRTISAPERLLKFLQRKILDRLLSPLGAHDCAYGFVRGRSIADNARPHINSQIVTNADVKNCFPSVKWSLVLGVLRRDLGKQLSRAAISYLVDICTAEGGMPIGAPTSPALLNRVLLKSDQILLAAATKRNCVYTRYADDLTFSGDKGAIELLGVAKRTLGQIGLTLDPKKTNIFRRGRRQMVTGLVVNDQVSIPRKVRRRLRAAVHRVQGGEVSHWHGSEQTTTALQGRLAFLQMVHTDEALTLKQRLIEGTARGALTKKIGD